MKKTARAVILLLLTCLLATGCIQSSGMGNNGVFVTSSLKGKPVLVGDLPCTFPLTENGKLNILSTVYSGTDYNDVFVWKKYEEMTGVSVNWTQVDKSERAETVASVLSNRQNIDLIIRCKISATRLTQYGKSGLILDLAKDGLLEKNAPNCWAYLQSHPDALASVTDPDGAIYSLPQVNSGAELRVCNKLFVNNNWLARVGMELPETTEEFYDLLCAFRDQDANGNGDTADEIPFCCPIWDGVQSALYGAFGLANRGEHNQVVDCDPESGGVRFIATSDAYRDFLEYLHRLYSEGLLDRLIFTQTQAQWSANIENDEVGVFASTNLAWIPADKLDDWVAIGTALEGPNGDKIWSAVRANFHSTGAAVIPAACRDPELVLRWLDYFWTDEGTLFYHMGIEGETFVAGDDGSYDYAQYIYDEMREKNKIFDDVVAAYSPYPGGGNPTVEIEPYFMGGEMADVPAQAARSLFEYGPEEYWPSFTFTAEENDRLDTLRTDIQKYTAVMRNAFITGEIPLSGSEWSTYVSHLDEMGVSDMLDIYSAAVSRYEALSSANR